MKDYQKLGDNVTSEEEMVAIAKDEKNDEEHGGHEEHHHGDYKHLHKLSPEHREIMEAYESLDYDEVENSLHADRQNELRRNDMVWEKRKETIQGWFVYFMVGLTVGTIAFLVAISVEELSEIRFKYAEDLLEEGQSFVAYVAFCGFAMLYVGFASFLVSYVEPAAGGSGIPELKGYLNGTNIPSLVKFKTLIVKVIGVIFSISGGLTCGKEGPLVHVGAVCGANYSHAPTLATRCGNDRYRRYRNDHDKRDFVSGGVAAGVAAAFGAPIGGVLFSLEEASSFWSLPLTWRVFFCAITSTFTFNILKSGFDGDWMEVNSPGLITFGAFVESAYRLWELPFFVFLGIIGGLFGAFFNHLNIKINEWRADNVKKVRPLRVVEAMFVAWLTASVFFWAPAVFDTGCKNDLAANTVSCVAHYNGTETFANGCIAEDQYYCPTESQIDTSMDHCQSVEDEEYAQYTCSEGKHNQLATLTFQSQEKAIKSFFHNQSDFGSSVLIVYFLLYFSLAVFTYGISVPSGLFVPGILIGCTYGRLLGEALQNSFEEIHPGTYALIGATSMLGGCTRMTISLTVILLETTNDIQYLLPIMMVLMISKWVGDFFNISLYDMHVELKCIPFVEALPPRIMEHMHVKEVMSTDVVLFEAITTVQHVVDILKSNEYNGFPVVNEKKKFIGLILRSQLIVLINKKAYITEASKEIVKNDDDFKSSRDKEMGYVRGERGALKISDFGTEINFVKHPDILLPELETESYDSLYLDLRPYMNPAPFSIQENTPLARVFRLYRSMGIRHLPVVDDENTVVGILTRKELRTDFSTDLY